MSQTPRYRCALEKGFFSKPTEIAFAKFDYRVGTGQRAEQGDEFDFDGTPGKWMEPINEAAQERVRALVASGQRATVGAESSAPTTPLKPPKSGMTRALTDADGFAAIRDVTPEATPLRPAPRRRAPAQAS